MSHTDKGRINAYSYQVNQVKATKHILMGIVLAAALIAPHRKAIAAGPDPVDLLSTANFAILAGAGITSTGGGMIDGDVGASPIAGSAIGITADQVNGIIYTVDSSGPAGSVVDPVLLTKAKGDLTTAYNDAAGRTPVPSGPFLNPNAGTGNIGGQNLVPGLYKFTTTAYITGSDLTLTGGPDDVWIFQCAQDLQLGSGIKVILAGGAKAGNIFWQVGTSATLGTYSEFKGTILADQDITIMTGSTIEGRALAFEAGVIFNGTGGSLPKSSQTITNFLPINASEFEGTDKVGLSAQATSLLPVSFMVGSGPGLITGGTNLVFSSTGLVSIVASQAGDASYDPAPNVTNMYNVLAAPMLDQTIIKFMPVTGSEFNVTRKIGLSAEATSLLPVSFMVGSGPGIITGGTNLVFSKTGTVSVVASQVGSDFYNAAPNVTNIYTILSEGMLSVVVTPEYGTWAIDGPAEYQGPMSGSGSLGPINVPVGVYTVQYGPLTGFWTPEGQMKTIESGDSVEFRGAYIVKVPGFGTNGVDLVVYERETGLWYALDPEDGQVLFWAEQWGGPGMIPVPGDYSGNGISDLSVYDMATGNWYIRTVSGTVTAWALNWGSAEYMPLIGDYNGNGMADLMVQSHGNGTWFGRTVGGEVLAWDISWGGLNFIAIPGDYNGDGVWDQAVYDTRSGNWYIRTIDNKLIAWAVRFGGPNMLPVVGDFDGDGVFDLAVYDHGNWYIRTLDGRVLAWGLPFGDETMRPVPGDYDGNGIWDLALYSESAGKWYVYSLTRGVLCWDFQFGGPGYAPLYW